jgi:hypothetical protein
MKATNKILILILQAMFVFSSVNIALAENEYVESGFLADYSILKPDPERPTVRMYMSEGADLGNYDKILLGDIELFLHPNSEYTGISSKKVAAIIGEFRKNLENNLGKRRELVTENVVGDKVLIIKFAITNVYATRPKRNLANYTPVGLASTGTKKAAGKDYVLTTAALEAAILDGETGELIAALVATGLGDELAKVKTGERKWKDIQQELKVYAETLRGRLN